MSKNFASAGDLGEKVITFKEIGRDLYAFTAQGDPNSGIIIGDDGVIVIDAQATPVAAKQVIERVRTVTTSRSSTSCSRTITLCACWGRPPTMRKRSSRPTPADR
jgi:hypothetical protein